MFPGQGSQYPGMLDHINQRLINQVANLTGIELNDDQNAYKDSVQIQLSILVIQLEKINQLKQTGFYPQIVCGHSLGVFAAAVAAGVISSQDSIRLVFYRALLMKKAYPKGYGMGVIVGLTRQEISKLVKHIYDENEPLFTSNQNSELQVTVSGSISAIKKVLRLSKKRGARLAKLLNVPNPSHSPLMQPVAEKLDKRLRKMNLKEPKCIYLTNYKGRAVYAVDQVRYDLGHNLAYPVYWNTMTDVAKELGTQVAIEFPPGHTFTRLLKRKDTNIHALTLSDMSVDDIVYLLNKLKRGSL